MMLSASLAIAALLCNVCSAATSSSFLARNRQIDIKEKFQRFMDTYLGESNELKLIDRTGVVPPISIPDQNTAVHLVISSYEDGERCARTLGFALEKAHFPRRLHFEVMQAMSDVSNQHHEADVSCQEQFEQIHLKEFCSKQPEETESCRADVLNRTHFWTIPLEEGLGAAHQRGLLQEKIDEHRPDEEALCLSMDAHMDFHRNFDDLTIAQWLKTGNEFAILTGYPMAMAPNQEHWANEHSHVDNCGYTGRSGIPRGRQGNNLPSYPGQAPYLTMNWAAGFSFHRCHADRNVPVDKNLEWIFDGEEIDRAVRLWTSGYDLYLPTVTTVYHDYGNARQRFWSHPSKDLRADQTALSNKRIKEKLGIKTETGVVPDFGVYGLGKQRSMEQFVEWSLIDFGPKWTDHLNEKGLKPKSFGSCQDAQLKRVPVKNEQELKATISK